MALKTSELGGRACEVGMAENKIPRMNNMEKYSFKRCTDTSDRDGNMALEYGNIYLFFLSSSMDLEHRAIASRLGDNRSSSNSRN